MQLDIVYVGYGGKQYGVYAPGKGQFKHTPLCGVCRRRQTGKRSGVDFYYCAHCVIFVCEACVSKDKICFDCWDLG